jgi:hypothetical protein
MNRVIPLETKVKIMEASLCLSRVEELAAANGVSAGAIYYWFNAKVKPALGEILQNDRPGPEPKAAAEVAAPPAMTGAAAPRAPNWLGPHMGEQPKPRGD